MPEVEEIKEEEDALIQSYMDLEEHEDMFDADYIEYLKARYESIKREYKALMFQKKEAKAQKREDLSTQIHDLATKNYRARKWAVKELRINGVPTVDQYVI